MGSSIDAAVATLPTYHLLSVTQFANSFFRWKQITNLADQEGIMELFYRNNLATLRGHDDIRGKHIVPGLKEAFTTYTQKVDQTSDE